MGFTLEFIFLYFNAYDSFTRKATIKCLERVRYSDYKLKEKIKLDQIKEEKKRNPQITVRTNVPSELFVLKMLLLVAVINSYS